MDNIAKRLKAYIEAHPFDPGDSDCETVLDQLYQVYQESHESDPPDIRDGFRELDDLLKHLPLEDNNTVFNLCCSLCTAYEHKVFLDGLQHGAHLMAELSGMKHNDIFHKPQFGKDTDAPIFIGKILPINL